MGKISRRMKRMFAIILVEVIVATNVFVSYADELSSDEPKVLAEMTAEEADSMAADNEQTPVVEDVVEETQEQSYEENAAEEPQQEAVEETPTEEPVVEEADANAEPTANTPEEIQEEEQGETSCICETACTADSCNEECLVCVEALNESSEEGITSYLEANCKGKKSEEPTATPTPTPEEKTEFELTAICQADGKVIEGTESLELTVDSLEALLKEAPEIEGYVFDKKVTTEDGEEMTEELLEEVDTVVFEYTAEDAANEDETTEIKIEAVYVDEEGNEIEGYDKETLTFDESLDLTEAPYIIDNYTFAGAKIDENIAKSIEKEVVAADETDEEATDTTVYSYINGDGEKVELTEDTVVTFTYEADQKSVEITLAVVDEEGLAIEGYEDAQLPEFESELVLNDIENAPLEVEGYVYTEAKMDDVVITKLTKTADEENEDVFTYAYETEEGESVAIEEDAVITFCYEEDAVAVKVDASIIDTFGDPIDDKYTNMDMNDIFGENEELTLDDVENPPVDKVQVRKGVFKVTKYSYVKATVDKEIITALKREATKATKDADEKEYIYSYTTDGTTWVKIKEDTTILLEYTDGKKSVFTYEDDQVLVTATLQHAGAVPDDSEFVVTPVTPQSGDYNYNAYMDALNKNADKIVDEKENLPEEGKAFTEKNTLLYDIAFMAPAMDEEGNVDEGNLVEYQPTEGMVSISFVFKKSQLSEDLQVEKAEEVTVVHLPLQESAKEEVSSTAEATNIAASDVNVEVVADSVSLSGSTDQADFCLSNFSVIAVVGGEINENPKMTDYSLNNILNNYNYFVFGNTDTIHTVGAVIVEGNATINAFGGASTGGDAPQGAPSYIKGTASGAFANNSATNVTDLVLYLGTVNYDAFKNAQVGPNYGGTLSNIIFTDDYVDFEAAYNSIKSEAGSIKCAVKITAQDISEMKKTDTYEVVEGWSGKKILRVHGGNTFELDGVNDLIQIDVIMDNVSDGNDTVVKITDGGDVTFPTTLVNGKAVDGKENGPGTSITWLFPSASKVSLPADTHVGHIIAPDSDVDIAGGTYNGCVIAKNLTSKGEGHMWSYTGHIFLPAVSGFKVQKNLVDVDGDSVDWPEGTNFTFTLKAIDGAPMPAGTTGDTKEISATSGAAIGFGEIEYPYPDDATADTITEYKYQISEKKESLDKITYDDTVYDVTVRVRYVEGSTKSTAVVDSVIYTTNKDSNAVTTDKDNTYIFENIYDNVERIDISVTKVWSDSDNKEGFRPDSIQVRLSADGEQVGDLLTLDASNNWSGSWKNLPKTNHKKEINYKVSEVNPSERYTVSVTGDATNGFTVTNSRTPEVVSVAGVKTWNDNNDSEGFRPETITVKLLKDGKEFASQEIRATNNWNYSFTDLPKYENGKEVVYTIKEVKVPGYTTSVNGYNLTNTHVPEYVNVSGTKTWDDNDDSEGFRPDSIKVNLFANGTLKDTKTVSAKENWSYEWKNLPKYADGKEVVYTITEEAVAHYETTVKGYDITNTHTPEYVTVEGTKTWNDNNDAEGFRPDKIKITLVANGKDKETKTVTAADGWNYKWENLPKYADGEEITYTVREEKVEDYSPSYDGYNVINDYTPNSTSMKSESASVSSFPLSVSFSVSGQANTSVPRCRPISAPAFESASQSSENAAKSFSPA